jgi:uncharacterized protein YcbK (DUF882 family)
MGDLSTNFSAKEFACPDCGKASVTGELIMALEELRTVSKLPIRILSGYRCPEHNASADGVSHSQHMLGKAADIRILGLNNQHAYEAALKVPAFYFGGIGVYDGNFLHVDVRDGKARWARVNGKYVGIDQLIKT